MGKQIRRVPVVAVLATTMILLVASPAFAFKQGRMTGGGRGDTTSGTKVTHGFELYCITQGTSNVDLGPNNLEVNWDGGNNWHLEELTRGACHSEGDPVPPNAPFNAYYGQGYGRLNGASGAFACWRLVDNGEGGKDQDVWSFNVWSPGAQPVPRQDPGVCPRPAEPPVLEFHGLLLTGGNHQAHRATGNKS